MDYPDVQLLIDGKWRAGAAGRTIPIVNPATEEVIGHVARAEIADLDAALAAAEVGFALWRNISAFERAKVLRRAGDLLRERARAHRELDDARARQAAERSADRSPRGRRHAGLVRRGEPPRLWPGCAGAGTNITNLVLKEPVGPVAAFSPWNFPLNQIVRKLGAALAAGCSIIVKAPEETPASPAELIRAVVDAGVPAGVVNLVYGVPAEISEYLIPHDVIRKISFTGSTAVGKQLAALAGKHMKRITMELGGHAPAIVFDDADVETAVKLLVAAKFRNAGQVCTAPTRFLVQEKRLRRFSRSVSSRRRSRLKIGDGLLPETQLGPLANSRRIEAMEAFIADAIGKGAELRTGGTRIGNKGYFFAPTVLANVPLSARAMNEEPFGPLALVNSFDDLDEALAEANRLPYGLASYAFTRSATTSAALAARLEAGMLGINQTQIAWPELPFGGVKDSGYGREGGSEAIQDYLVTKLVTQAAG